MRARARELRRIVRAALKRPEAIAWRDRIYPECARWDDGVCGYVARAIACFDGHRGEVCDLYGFGHTGYCLDGWMIDGHRIAPRNHRAEPEGYYGATRQPPRTLVRLMREEAAKP